MLKADEQLCLPDSLSLQLNLRLRSRCCTDTRIQGLPLAVVARILHDHKCTPLLIAAAALPHKSPTKEQEVDLDAAKDESPEVVVAEEAALGLAHLHSDTETPFLAALDVCRPRRQGDFNVLCGMKSVVVKRGKQVAVVGSKFVGSPDSFSPAKIGGCEEVCEAMDGRTDSEKARKVSCFVIED